MVVAKSDTEQVIERLSLQLLEDAYYDLAAVLRGAQPQAAAAIFGVMEQRVADALMRMCEQRSEGAASMGIAIAVGERLSEIMDPAHGKGALGARAA